MRSFYLVLGILALSTFTYANSQGWSLFHSTAQSQSSGPGGSGRLYHK
jgi:hypothetical protein